MDMASVQSKYEHRLIAIVRKLPPERRSELLTFARFLVVETYKADELESLEDEAGVDIPDTTDSVRWDALLASEEGQLALDKLADEALADIRANKVTSGSLGSQEVDSNLQRLRSSPTVPNPF